MNKNYIPRLFDQIIEFSLKSKGAVVIVGPKWCGKNKRYYNNYYNKSVTLDDEI